MNKILGAIVIFGGIALDGIMGFSVIGNIIALIALIIGGKIVASD